MTATSLHVQTPPFLTKLYQLVSDPATNALVSWTDGAGQSFTVHKPSEFGRDILPKYFKHNNFSSFVRQLNQYGFHKQNPDQWMFGHQHFRKNRPDLLTNISRRRPKQNAIPSTQAVVPGPLTQKAVVELGNYGIEGEVKSLKRDKDLLIKELVVTRQAEEKLKNKCENLESRMESLENSSKQMQTFIMHYFSQVLQPYSEAMASRKRKRLPSSSASEMLDIISDDASSQVTHPAPAASMDTLRVMMQQMQMNLPIPPAQPRTVASPNGPQRRIVEAAAKPSQLKFEPATILELPHDESNSSSTNGHGVRQECDEASEKLDFLGDVTGDLTSTPQTSLTMDLLENVLKSPMEQEKSALRLLSPGQHFSFNDDDTRPEVSNADGTPTHKSEEQAIEEFLDLSPDDSLPPPLTHLPEGTDIQALARRIEGFGEQGMADGEV